MQTHHPVLNPFVLVVQQDPVQEAGELAQVDAVEEVLGGITKYHLKSTGRFAQNRSCEPIHLNDCNCNQLQFKFYLRITQSE